MNRGYYLHLDDAHLAQMRDQIKDEPDAFVMHLNNLVEALVEQLQGKLIEDGDLSTGDRIAVWFQRPGGPSLNPFKEEK